MSIDRKLRCLAGVVASKNESEAAAENAFEAGAIGACNRLAIE